MVNDFGGTMEPTEIIHVDEKTVACDGGGGDLGHPNVYLNLEEKGEIICPYCSRKFILSESANKAAGH